MLEVESMKDGIISEYFQKALEQDKVGDYQQMI